MARVLFVEPYFGGSHRAFAEGIAGHSRHTVDLLTLPGRNWKWRMRGSAPVLATRAGHGNPPDLIFASSMLNLPEFIALASADFHRIPSILYFHENQLTYPLPEGEKRDLHFAITHTTSILLSYPEILDPGRFPLCYYDTREELFERAVSLLTGGIPPTEAIRSEIARYEWTEIVSRFDALFAEMRGETEIGKEGDWT